MPARWGTVAAYAAVAAANQLLWLTYAPITTDAARHFDVSEGAIGWLSQVFPLLYVILAIPAGLALDRRFRSALLFGAWLTAVGGAVRLGSDTFAAALAGQILIAIAQPLILNAVTKIAVVSVPDALAKGISFGSAGIFAGTALALPLGPALAGADTLTPLLVVDLLVAVVAAGGLTIAMRDAATRSPVRRADRTPATGDLTAPAPRGGRAAPASGGAGDLAAPTPGGGRAAPASGAESGLAAPASGAAGDLAAPAPARAPGLAAPASGAAGDLAAPAPARAPGLAAPASGAAGDLAAPAPARAPGLAAPASGAAGDLAAPAPARAPGLAAPAYAGRAELRAVWGDRAIRRLAGVAFLGFGVFVALTTWLQALLEPAGVSDATAGWLLGAMVLAGVVGSALLPEPLVRRHAERRFLRTAAVVTAAGCVFLAVAPGAAVVGVVPLGVVLLGSLPVILELTERRSRSSAATAVIWLAGNAGGIVVAVLVQATQNHPGVAFSLLAVTGALVLTVA